MAWQAGGVEPADDAQVRGWLAVFRRELLPRPGTLFV
jgi:hypothetical protein